MAEMGVQWVGMTQPGGLIFFLGAKRALLARLE